jgi:23S rRNA pseudouridine1911/1915/1917 synthase
VTKIYWGAVEGDLHPAEGVWEDWLLKIQDESRTEIVASPTERSRWGVLSYRKLRECAGGTLIEFVPQTGRMHQIRAQTGLRGWPIRGDTLYGSKLAFGPAAELPRDRIIALHARSLTFLHPIRFEPITVTAPLPPTWHELGVE